MHIKQTHMKKEKLLMQKVNKSSVKKGAALCLAMAMACTAFVGCGKKDDAASASGATSESAVEVLDNSKLTEMPDGVSLSEDQMKTTMNAYAAYMTEALASDGYTVAVRYDEDGSVHFDGTKTAEDGSTVEVPDLSKFDNLSAAFAYLYNCGQADAEGNLLVSTSVSAEEVAASEAESTADSEASDSEAESTETDGDAAESTEEASSEDTAEADSAAESEAPADETAVG
jgi:hypothetical protein